MALASDGWLDKLGPSAILALVIILLLWGKLTTNKQCSDKLKLMQQQVDLMKELNAPTEEAHPFRRKTDPEPPEHPYRRRDDPEELRNSDDARHRKDEEEGGD